LRLIQLIDPVAISPSANANLAGPSIAVLSENRGLTTGKEIQYKKSADHINVQWGQLRCPSEGLI